MERRVIPGYEVGSPIGFGAGGTALAVRDAEGTSFAAVVVPKAGHRERFEELRALRHPHLPPIRALVEMNEHDVAVIMDLVVGPSLATLVNARTWLEPAEIATVWHGIADALAAMHHRGLVHGDVSPANVVIGPGGRPVLIDIVGHGGAERGHTGYIPPELDHGPATAASDVWSLARTLAWASGENAEVTDHLRGALAEDPTERPTAREFATWAHLLGEALPLEVPDAAALAGAQIRSAAAPTVLTPRPPERWPWQVLAAAVAGGLSLLMFAGHALGSAAEPPRAVAPRDVPDPGTVHDVVVDLLGERDSALAAGDAVALAAVYQPGSRIAEVDQALADEIARDGIQLLEYGTDVLSVETVSTGRRSFVARVEARQRAHERLDPDGSREVVGRQEPHCVQVTAVERASWLIADLEVCE